MESLFAIENSTEHSVIKTSLLKAFRNRFTNAKLTKTTKTGTQQVVVTAKDPIHVTARQIFRSDLIRYVAALSDDVMVSVNGQNITLQNFLNQQLDVAVFDQNHALNDNRRSIWIDYAYGLSEPRVVNNDDEAKPSSNELQLIITAVTDGLHPADNARGVACFTTASMSKGGGPIQPPFSIPVHPQD